MPNVPVPVPGGDFHRGAFDDTVMNDLLNTFAQVSPNAQKFLILELAQSAIVAKPAGTQATSTPITGQTASVDTVVSIADGVLLMPSQGGLEVLVMNTATNAMQVFASGADTIDGVAGATGVSQMGGSLVIYTCAAPGVWKSEGLATGYWGPGLQSNSWEDAITALAGGAQAGATVLRRMINRVVTVVTAGDSVKFPLSSGGANMVTTNASANAMNLWPAIGEAINALAINTALSIPAGKTATAFVAAPGIWHVVIGA
jgi:hypothetical protein